MESLLADAVLNATTSSDVRTRVEAAFGMNQENVEFFFFSKKYSAECVDDLDLEDAGLNMGEGPNFLRSV